MEDYAEWKSGKTYSIAFSKNTDGYGVTFADLAKVLGTTNIDLSGTRDGVPQEDATDLTYGIVRFEIRK